MMASFGSTRQPETLKHGVHRCRSQGTAERGGLDESTARAPDSTLTRTAALHAFAIDSDRTLTCQAELGAVSTFALLNIPASRCFGKEAVNDHSVLASLVGHVLGAGQTWLRSSRAPSALSTSNIVVAIRSSLVSHRRKPRSSIRARIPTALDDAVVCAGRNARQQSPSPQQSDVARIAGAAGVRLTPAAHAK
jgi:hypothetical protein